MQKLSGTGRSRARRWVPDQRLKVSLSPGSSDSWVPQVGERVRALTRSTQVVLDVAAVDRLDLEELAALAHLLGNLKACGHSMVLQGLRPGPLSLLVRLGLTRQLGVRSGQRRQAGREQTRRVRAFKS